jgi:O-antigen/teichoic acid export membrane protein
MKPLYYKIVFSAFLAGLSALVSFGLNVQIARIFGSDVFADFSYYISIVTILAVFSSVGMNQYLLLKLPIMNEGEIEKLNAEVDSTLVLICLPVLSLLSFFLYFKGENLITIISIVGISFFSSLFLIKQSVYIALKRVFVFQFCDKIARNSLLLVLFFFASNYIKSFSVFIFFVFIGHIISFLLIQYNLASYSKFRVSKSLLSYSDVKSTYPLYLVLLSVTLMGNLDIIIVDFLSTSQEVAVFSASQKVALLAGFLVNAIANILVPYFVKASEEKQDAVLNRQVRFSSLFGFISIFIFLIIISFTGEYVLSVFGVSYIAGFPILLVLVINALLSAIYGQTLTLMKVKKEGLKLSKYIIFALIIKLLLTFNFYKYFDVIGIAYSSTLCIFIWNHLSYRLLKKKYNINTFVFQR